MWSRYTNNQGICHVFSHFECALIVLTPPPIPCGITSWSDLVALVAICLKPFVLVKWTLNPPSRSYPSSHRENLRLITRISEPLYSHRHIDRHSCTVWLIWRPWSASVLLLTAYVRIRKAALVLETSSLFTVVKAERPYTFIWMVLEPLYS